MVRKYIFLAIFILSAIAIIGYFVFKPDSSNIVQTEQRIIKEKYSLTPDTSKGYLYINFDIEIPVFYSNDSVLQQIRETLFSSIFGKKYSLLSKDTVVKSFVDLIKREYKINNADLVEQLGEDNEYSFRNDHELGGYSLINDGIIYSYGISRFVYMGGAHGQSTQNYFNFDMKDGSLIQEADIFKEGFEDQLSEIIRNKIISDSYNDDEIDDLVDLESSDYQVENIKPNGNFYFNEEGICYVFNVYEIAPYYMGLTEVSLPFSSIKHLLRPNSVISYMVNQETP